MNPFDDAFSEFLPDSSAYSALNADDDDVQQEVSALRARTQAVTARNAVTHPDRFGTLQGRLPFQPVASPATQVAQAQWADVSMKRPRARPDVQPPVRARSLTDL